VAVQELARKAMYCSNARISKKGYVPLFKTLCEGDQNITRLLIYPNQIKKEVYQR
jgi:hypothetical protein